MFTRDQLGEILWTRSGDLQKTPYPLLLLAFAAHERSGILELRRNQLEKTVIFDDGSPVECRSNIATEMLDRYLVSSGKVAEQDCRAAFAVAASRRVPLGEILTERKLIAPTELYRALQQNLGRRLLEPFSWKSGTWSISHDMPPTSSVARVKVPQLIVTGIVKIEAQETADEAVASAAGKYLALTDEPLFPLDEIRLGADQQKIVEAARRGASFDEIRAMNDVDADDLNRFVYALMLLGIARITDTSMPEAIRVEIAPSLLAQEPEVPVAAAAPAEARFAVAAPSVERAGGEEVMAAYLSFRRKDAFDLLELEETEGASAITKAYLRMADRFLPSRFPDGDPMREKAQDVFLAAARAYAELADPLRREALVKRREKLREEAAAREKAGPAALIDPEELLRSGRTLMAAGKLREALSSFEMAADCDAQNGTYAAEAAWCRFRLGISPASNAIKLLKNAIRIDPASGVAHLYAGQVLSILGKRIEGQAYVSRAASLLPGDPRPAHALKVMQ